MTVPPQIFARDVYRARRARAAHLPADRFLVAEAAEGVAERIGAVNRRFRNALELSSRQESAWALTPVAESWTRLSLSGAEPGDAVGDEEALPFAPESFDLIASVLSLHAVNDLPGALLQIRRALKPDGLFVAALFAGDTLLELRESFAQAEETVRGGISPRVAPFADVRSLGGLLQRAGFALPVADAERTQVRYRDPLRLFADLRAMGETNCLIERETRPLTKSLIAALFGAYGARAEEGRLPATFDIVYLTGWAPHDSQQKPLKPGSATARLADALGTDEKSV